MYVIIVDCGVVVSEPNWWTLLSSSISKTENARIVWYIFHVYTLVCRFA